MLHADAIRHQYGDHLVLNNVHLTLPGGTLGILAGYNGSGKTTLLRCLAGWTRPQAGTVEINGVVLLEDDRRYRQQVILVPDTPDFYDELTAWEHLQLVSQLHGIADWHNRAVDLLEAFHLEYQYKAYPFTFSRGMRYKLALAMAMLVQPPLLLLDEPFGPLDPDSALILYDLLREMRDAGSSVLLSAHTLPETVQPDHYFILDQGSLTHHLADGDETLLDLLRVDSQERV